MTLMGGLTPKAGNSRYRANRRGLFDWRRNLGEKLMSKSLWLASACAFAVALPAAAQTAEPAPAAADQTAQAADVAEEGEIIVTATRRAESLQDVPIAVSAVTAESLQNSGATDIRQLNQLSPSLLVSSTSSEAGAGVARIRGIGTVGDNPGLESSVAVFIDGVYRNRSGVALTELGEIDRIEVLRGPQGTLFGRNASAGLISVHTARPKFEHEGMAEFTYGNYDFIRASGSLTGPIIDDTLAFRIDGVYTERDGFLEDVISGRTINDRDRYLIRGQLQFEPNDDLSIRIIGDYADRDEECCGATYLPARNVTRNAQGQIVYGPSTIAGLLRSLGGVINDDTFNRETAITPGRTYNSDVQDWGVSAEVTWNLGFGTLTSITAYRDWQYDRGQDADFNNLDILARDGWEQTFETFTQELRLQGTAFDDKLDWLIGAYYADEKLKLFDNLEYGADYQRYADRLIAATGFTYQAIANALGQPGLTLNNVGVTDNYQQDSTNYAFFTHNVFNITDRLALTVGVRYTNEEKDFESTLLSDNDFCRVISASPFAALNALPCVINSRVDGSYSDRRKEDEWSGTVVLSYKATDDILTYASFSRGYKAGGFNLDRSALTTGSPDPSQLQFESETVDAYEVGVKFDGRQVNLNIAAFYSEFSDFQLNTFNGVNFIVENVNSCNDDLGGADQDLSAATGACTGGTGPGVTTQGVEVEANFFPADDFAVNLGLTYADTKYEKNLVGADGRPLAPTLFQLPGRRISNAPEWVMTGSAGWTPPITDSISGLAYVDFRYQSEINTGSDLDIEKIQQGFVVVNARIGIRGEDERWALELWAQNLLNEQYQQVSFDATLQGSGTTRAVQQGLSTSATTLYGAFLAEPRTYGVTLRTRF